MIGPDTPLRVNAQAGTWAMPRLVPTARVVGLAAVTSSGVVAQAGQSRLLVSSLKVRASLSTGTFMVAPPGQVTTPAGVPVGADPVKTRLPLPTDSLAWPDGKPPLGPADRSSVESTTRPVRQAFASGERAQATASCRASASKAPTFTAPGGGLAVDMPVGIDAGPPTLPTEFVPGRETAEVLMFAAHPATATIPRQAASRDNDRRPTRTITASREGISTTVLDAARPASVPPRSR